MPYRRRIADWHGKVYNKHAANDNPVDDIVRLHVIERDRNRCVICEGTRKLEVHHVVPRSCGGSNYAENLVTLCPKCHDEVEIAEYRSLDEIRCHVPEWKQLKRAKRKPPAPVVDDTELSQSDWRMWVYGGYRNPDK